MLGSGNLANIDVGIRRLTALDLNDWAGAADVIGELRGECPDRLQPRGFGGDQRHRQRRRPVQRALQSRRQREQDRRLHPKIIRRKSRKNRRVITSKLPDDAA